MAKTAEMDYHGEKIIFNENEIDTVTKYREFEKAQKESEENKLGTAWKKDPHGEEPEYQVLVDPYEDQDWFALSLGFLAAHGLLGSRGRLIAVLLRYQNIQFV